MSRAQLSAIETAHQVKLENNPELWGTELLWAALRNEDRTKPWIVGGDLNTCETFDQWAKKPRGNREFLDRMEDLGFTEVLRESQGRLTPTYRNFKTGEIRNQMDHIFVTEPLARLLVKCDVGDADRVFGGGLSDHLPIVADFRERII